jgi:hypothetical protein
MTKFKDFGTGSETDQTEPIVFKIHGEEFTCKPAIQGKVLISLASQAASEDASDAAKSITTLFDSVLIEESLERFNLLLVDDKRIVSVETLSEIVAWLIETYTQRPNQQPEV